MIHTNIPLKDKYINLFTDFGFKRLFGEEPNKDLLISFLNTLLPAEHQIHDLSYSNTERQGYNAFDRKAMFDLHCKSANGERFVIELQKVKYNYFKDRSIYYTSFPIQDQAHRGDWNYSLSPVYCIGILDFVFTDLNSLKRQDVVHYVQLKNQPNEGFYDKLTFIYLTLPNFNKKESELTSLQDKWFYLFRYLDKFEDRPTLFYEHIFDHVFEVTELIQLSQEEFTHYVSGLKYYWDMNGFIEAALYEGMETGEKRGLMQGREEGIVQGKAEGREESREVGIVQGKAEGKHEEAWAIAEKLLPLLDDAAISESTGLTIDRINVLRTQHSL